jgi:hypothetical protein
MTEVLVNRLTELGDAAEDATTQPPNREITQPPG